MARGQMDSPKNTILRGMPVLNTNQQSPQLIIPKEGPIHHLPMNQFMNATEVPDLFWIWLSSLGKTDTSTMDGGGGVYKPVRARDVHYPFLGW